MSAPTRQQQRAAERAARKAERAAPKQPPNITQQIETLARRCTVLRAGLACVLLETGVDIDRVVGRLQMGSLAVAVTGNPTDEFDELIDVLTTAAEAFGEPSEVHT